MDTPTSNNQPTIRLGLSFWLSLLILIGFFLPWVRACGFEVSGLDLATNKTKGVDWPWIYWATLIAAGISLAIATSRPESQRQVTKNLWLKLILVGLGAIPPLIILKYTLENKDTFKLLYGWWVVMTGLVGTALATLRELAQFER